MRWTLTVLLLTAGCSGLGERDRAWVREEVERAVRRVCEEHERASLAGQVAPHYEWAPPQLQMVREPAHIEGGAFHPEQVRPVIVAPGEWAPARRKREVRRER